MQELKKAAVLIVEDENPLAEVIQKKFEKNGVQVVVSRNVQQSLEQLQNNNSIEAIWLDHYLLGHESGLDLLQRIKAPDSQWKDIPIFVVSNTATADKVNSYVQMGVQHYYTKSNHRLDEIVDEVCSSIGR